MCLASLFTTNANTGMSAVTNASLIVDDRNAVLSMALNNVSSLLSAVLFQSVVTAPRLRTRPTLHVSWVCFQCHDPLSTNVVQIYQPVRLSSLARHPNFAGLCKIHHTFLVSYSSQALAASRNRTTFVAVFQRVPACCQLPSSLGMEVCTRSIQQENFCPPRHGPLLRVWNCDNMYFKDSSWERRGGECVFHLQ